VHGATPELGENAILKMLPILQRLATDFARQIGDVRYEHTVLGRSTVNFGTIRGGMRKNIVADLCQASLDIRFTPLLHQRGAMALLEEFLRGEDVEIRSFGECAPLDTDPQNPFVQKLARVGNGLAGAPWFCDAAWLAAAGIPGVAAGPGSIAQAHTCDEYLSLTDLDEGVGFYQRFLEAL
jgi:acetylornithine deacetylase/succinyl-diaminopimelate desuccinylase-like protein